MCPCGCGSLEEKFCWKKSEWNNTCEFCNEPSKDGVCVECGKAITEFEKDMKNECN